MPWAMDFNTADCTFNEPADPQTPPHWCQIRNKMTQATAEALALAHVAEGEIEGFNFRIREY